MCLCRRSMTEIIKKLKISDKQIMSGELCNITVIISPFRHFMFPWT